jgi:hypothetical protein
VQRGHYNRENNEVVEFTVAHQSTTELMLSRKIRMPHAIQIRQTGGPQILTPGSELDTDRSRPAQGGSGAPASGGLTRPTLFHYIERRDDLDASANELFEVVASGKVRIDVNQRFAIKDAADDKALEARPTSGSAMLTM